MDKHNIVIVSFLEDDELGGPTISRFSSASPIAGGSYEFGHWFSNTTLPEVLKSLRYDVHVQNTAKPLSVNSLGDGKHYIDMGNIVDTTLHLPFAFKFKDTLGKEWDVYFHLLRKSNLYISQTNTHRCGVVYHFDIWENNSTISAEQQALANACIAFAKQHYNAV